MITLLRTDAAHADFHALVRELDVDIARRDGEEFDFYKQFNGVENLAGVVLAYADGQAVGCGGFRRLEDDSAEIKRMFVDPTVRGQGVASKVLAELEAWAKELGATRCILETGSRFHEAMALYQKQGYQRVANYGPYVGVEDSRCFEKVMG